MDIEKVLPIDGQPQSISLCLKRSRLKLVAVGGFSYAFKATMQIVTRNTNAKKSYSVIGISPFPGLGLTAYRVW